MPTWLEEPTIPDDIAGHARIVQQGGVPIATGENLHTLHEFTQMILILIDAHRRHDWLIGAVNKRLREEFAKLQVEIRDEKSSGVPTPAYG
jgi:hypothetical protein